MSELRTIWGVLAAALALSALYGEMAGSPFTWIYIVITVVLAALVALIHRTVELPRRVLWGLVGAAIGNLAGGILLVSGQPLYVLRLVGELRYDKPYHFVATGIATWAAYEVLAPRLRGSVSDLVVGWIAVLVGIGVGALVEIVEYTGSVVIENANIGDYANNMLDLVANLAGAVLAVLLIRVARNRSRTEDGSRQV